MFRYDRMNELVKETGIKKVHICRLLGGNPYYLRDAEKNNVDISGETLKVIAETLRTTPAYLRGETDEKYPAPDRSGIIAEIMLLLRGLSPEDQQKVLEYAAFVKSRAGQ